MDLIYSPGLRSIQSQKSGLNLARFAPRHPAHHIQDLFLFSLWLSRTKRSSFVVETIRNEEGSDEKG